MFIEMPEFVAATKQTLDMIYAEKDSGELASLYQFYCYTARWQKTDQPKCTNSFVGNDKALGWGEAKIIKYKKKLIEMGLIENIKRVSDSGKIVGWFIKVKWLVTDENQTIDFARSGEKPGQVESQSNALPLINTNALPLIESNPNAKNPEEESSSRNEDGEYLVEQYNRIFEKKMKLTEVKTFEKNLTYWLGIFTIDEIVDALESARLDTWWKERLTPVILLRRRNPQGEDVNWIGNFLAKKPIRKPYQDEGGIWRNLPKPGDPDFGKINY